MGRLLPEISPNETSFIAEQPVFFIATAPSSDKQYVNVSPRAPGSSLQVIDGHTVALCDQTGSGSETAAHILQNSRITIMIANLMQGPPKILRLHGTAQILLPNEIDKELLSRFPSEQINDTGLRAIYYIKVQRITSSCGFTMPIMNYEKHRNTLVNVNKSRGKDGMLDYRILKNSYSIDGLPSIAHIENKDKTILPLLNQQEEGYIFGSVQNGERTIPQIDQDKKVSKMAFELSQSGARTNLYEAVGKKNKESNFWLFMFISFLCGVMANQIHHLMTT